jgi:3-methylfumaryl-CoA hydratase
MTDATPPATALLSPAALACVGRSVSIGPVEITRREIVKYAIATEQRSARFLQGDEAPPMFLCSLMFPLVPLSVLGPDGLPPRALQPELPLRRVMAGGARSRYFRPVRPGDVLVGTLTLASLHTKEGRSGPLIFAEYALEVGTVDGDSVMHETQIRIAR